LRSIAAGWLLLMLLSCVPPATIERESKSPVILRDSFPNGTPELTWRPFPYFNKDNLKGAIDPSSPESEQGVGVLDNGVAGGFAALSYADTLALEDFRLEAWLKIQVTEQDKGPLNGIAFRVDPVNDKYYRFAVHFAAEPVLSLAYVGKDSKHFPVMVQEWKASVLPGGAPKRSGWHRVVIEVKDNRVEIFWDGHRLPGGPFPLDRIDSGFIGLYATFTGGVGMAETRIDGLRVNEP